MAHPKICPNIDLSNVGSTAEVRWRLHSSDPSAGSVVRLALTTDRSAPRIVQGAPAGAGRHNPYTLVGNRIGLEFAAPVERRDGEIWLVPAPARATGLAAFQGGASSVASR